MINKFLRAGTKVLRRPAALANIALPQLGTTASFSEFKSPILQSNATILKSLSVAPVNHALTVVPVTKYVSPYRTPAPLRFMVLFNRSLYAMQTAEDALKDPWPGMTTIHVVQAGREHALGANLVIEVEKFNCIEHFMFGLGTPVTPYSEAQKQGIYAIRMNDDIQPKTIEVVHAYLKKGGKLKISNEILYWFADWRTLLPRPDIVEQLLRNHGIPLDSNHDQRILDESLDVEADRNMLQALLPNTPVTDEVIMTYYMFDKIALTALQRRDHSKLANGARNMTVMMDAPAFVYDPNKKVGDSFEMEGEKITILKIQPNPDTGMIDIDFELQGHIIRTSGINPNAQSTASKVVQWVTDPKKESGAPMSCKLLLFKVKPDDKVKPGQTAVVVEAMKMEHLVTVPDDDGEELTVETIHGDENDIVAKNQVLVRYRRS